MSNLTNKKALAPWMKIAATGGILLGAAAIVGSGAFAVFTSSATANSSLNAGSAHITMSSSNITLTGMTPGDTVQQLLTISFAQSAATGDQITGIDFSVAAGSETTGTNPAASGTSGSNDGTGSSLFTGSVASTISSTAYPDGTTNQGATQGSSALTYIIQTCATQWQKVSPSVVYTCATTPVATAGSASTVLNGITNTAPLKLYPIDFGNSSTASTTAPNQTPFVATTNTVALYSMISITLPRTANNSFEGASVPLTFNASAEQRAGVTTAP